MRVQSPPGGAIQRRRLRKKFRFAEGKKLMRTRLTAGDKELKRAICGVASVRCTKTGAASLPG
jgi:hypothetical protein